MEMRLWNLFRVHEGIYMDAQFKGSHVAFPSCRNRTLKGHCIEFKYYADGVHSGLIPPG